jgi:hypothetical protein
VDLWLDTINKYFIIDHSGIRPGSNHKDSPMNILSKALRPLGLLLLGSLAIGNACLMGQDTNIAKDQPAQISSNLWSDTDLSPKGGNDGIKNGGFGFHTQNSSRDNPQWWQVDLQGIYKISQIKVYNRMTDNCSGRAANLQVLYSTDGNKFFPLNRTPAAGKVFGGIRYGRDVDPLKADGNNQDARYVRLLLNDGQPLHLDEVEVYGTLDAAATEAAAKAGIPEMSGTPGMSGMPGIPR